MDPPLPKEWVGLNSKRFSDVWVENIYFTCERQFEERLRQERPRFAWNNTEICSEESRQRERFTECPEKDRASTISLNPKKWKSPKRTIPLAKSWEWIEERSLPARERCWSPPGTDLNIFNKNKAHWLNSKKSWSTFFPPGTCHPMEQGGHLAWKESAVREAQRLQVIVAKEGNQPDNFFYYLGG